MFYLCMQRIQQEPNYYNITTKQKNKQAFPFRFVMKYVCLFLFLILFTCYAIAQITSL